MLDIERTCGECTACCLTHANFEIKKAPGLWCEHCEQGKGCRVYDIRPAGCQSFHCEWLKGYGSDDWRPDRCGVVLDFVRSPALGELLQVWEAKDGYVDLTNPLTVGWVSKVLAAKIFVSILFIRGNKILFLPDEVGVDESLYELIHLQGIKIAILNDFAHKTDRPS